MYNGSKRYHRFELSCIAAENTLKLDVLDARVVRGMFNGSGRFVEVWMRETAIQREWEEDN